MKRIGVLFVCLGNICRSPYAEGAFRALVTARKRDAEFLVDSCGTGDWHVGEPPDPRTVAVGRRRGLALEQLRARRLTAEDFGRFDWILAVDRAVLAEIERRRPLGSPARVALVTHALGGPSQEVPDPYYGGPEGFERMADLLDEAGVALLEALDGGSRG